MTLVERDERVGGKLRTAPFAGRLVDDGADAFLLRVPWALDLCREVGIDGELVHPASARGLRVEPRRAASDAAAAHGGADRPRRAGGQRPRVPGRHRPGPSRISTAPATPLDEDVTVAEAISRRLGDEVLERLVDPLVARHQRGRHPVAEPRRGGAAARRGRPRHRSRQPRRGLPGPHRGRARRRAARVRVTSGRHGAAGRGRGRGTARRGRPDRARRPRGRAGRRPLACRGERRHQHRGRRRRAGDPGGGRGRAPRPAAGRSRGGDAAGRGRVRVRRHRRPRVPARPPGSAAGSERLPRPAGRGHRAHGLLVVEHQVGPPRTRRRRRHRRGAGLDRSVG